MTKQKVFGQFSSLFLVCLTLAVMLLVVLVYRPDAPGLATVAAQGVNDWPQLQYDAKRTGHNPQSLAGPFDKRWQRDLGVAMADRIQPVIAGGRVIVGDLAGTVHALNESNGTVAWTFATEGAILYSAAIDNGTVFVGSHDGYLYALNLSSGAQIWRSAVPMGSGGPPLVVQNRVFVGGKDGFFYAFNAADGSQLWQFNTAATNPPSTPAPILTSAAYDPGSNRVYFAAENLKAYALNANNGNLVWVAQMYGESAYDSWPVISETQNVVMFRTKSVYSFHASLYLDDEQLFCPGNAAGACSSCENLNPASYNSPGEEVRNSGSTKPQWDEQHLLNSNSQIESIDEIFAASPQRLTFYAFDLDTGAARWTRPAPILWTGGGGRGGIMPVVNDSTGAIYTMWRTKFSRRDQDYFCRRWVDVGELTVRDNLPTVDFLPCDGNGSNCPNGDFHFIGDETTVLSLAGDLLLLTGWFNTGGLNVVNGSSDFVVGSGPGGMEQGVGGTGGDSAIPASVANKTIFVKHHQGFPNGDGDEVEAAPYTIIAAYEGQ